MQSRGRDEEISIADQKTLATQLSTEVSEMVHYLSIQREEGYALQEAIKSLFLLIGELTCEDAIVDFTFLERVRALHQHQRPPNYPQQSGKPLDPFHSFPTDQKGPKREGRQAHRLVSRQQ